MWKLVIVDGKVKLDAAGLPVYVNEKGEERGYDVDRMVTKISELNTEAKDNRIRAEAAEGKIKEFGELTPQAASEAVKKMQAIADKKLWESGDVDKLRTEISTSFQSKLDAEKDRADKAVSALDNELIGGAFMRSAYIKDNLTVPPDMVRSVFGSHFKNINGRIEAFDSRGQEMLSRKSPGERPSFDEAVEILVDGYSGKDTILKSKQGSGSGARGSSTNASGQKQITRAQHDAMSAAERGKHFAEGGTIVD